MALYVYESYESAVKCFERARWFAPDSLRWAYYLGLALAVQGRSDEAIEALRDAIRIDETNVAVRTKLGELLLETAQAGTARTQFEQALLREPDSPFARYGLGRALAAAGRPEEAVAELEKVCLQTPQYGAAHYALGLAYRDLKNAVASKRHLTLYERNRNLIPPPDNRLATELQEMDRSAGGHIARASVYLANSLVAEAINEYKAAVKVEPDNVAAHSTLIGLYLHTSEFKAAERHYGVVMELKPDSAKAHFNYGLILLRQERHEEAVAQFRRSLRVNPLDAHSYQRIGHIREVQGRYDEAMQHYRRALECDPNHRLANFQLGRRLAKNGQLRASVPYLQKSVGQQDERTGWYLRVLAGVHSMLGEREQSMARAQEARDLAITYGDSGLVGLLNGDIETLERGGTLE